MTRSITKYSSLALICWLLVGELDPTYGFLPRASFGRMRAKTPIRLALTSPNTQTEDATAVPDDVAKYKAEAERMRLEAERMDMSLTLSKIESIERKLTNKAWVLKHPEEQVELGKKLQDLKKKVKGDDAPPTSARMSLPVAKAQVVDGSESKPPAESTETTSVKSAPMQQIKSSPTPQNENPISGFDEQDLELYLPVATEIEERMPNATIEEKLEALREAPELQVHFQRKIQAMLVQPMEDMQRLDELKNQYLYSSSSVEKEQLKREIQKLEQSVEDEGPFAYSDSISLEVAPMSDEELQTRVEAIEKLPPILQSLYKKRTGAGEDGDVRLAIMLEHYDHQLQILDQIRYALPLTDEMRGQAMQSLQGLPSPVRDHVARGVGLENGDDIDSVLRELSSDDGDDPAWKMLSEVVEAASKDAECPEYNDIDFIDRSRFVKELYPAIARLEDQHPGLDAVEQFLKEVLDKKAFMVKSKPERVTGGYYIRGENLISDDEFGKKLVAQLEKNLAASSLNDKVDFFYIPDPSPLSDEQIELGDGEQPVLLVAAKNDAVLYDHALPLTKSVVSALGIFSVALFALATCQLQPALQERLDAAIAVQEQDISWLTDISTPVFFSMLSIQFAHEAGHLIVALRDKASNIDNGLMLCIKEAIEISQYGLLL